MASALTQTLAPAALAATGLVGGFGVASTTRNRPLGGAVLAAAGVGAFTGWKKNRGAGTATGLTLLYLGAFGGSHPLAKKLGAWPSVFAVTGGVVAASLLFGRAPRKLTSFEQVAENFRDAAQKAGRH